MANPHLAQLVLSCRAGDRGAWRELHRALFPTAIAFLRQMGVPPDDIDDVSQEVFVQVYRYLATFESRSDVRTWLYRICLSQAGRLRRRARLTRLVTTLFPRRDEDGQGHGQGDVGHAFEPSEGPGLSDEEAKRRVARALERLGEKHRAVLLLFEVEGLTGEQIAEVMNCPVATVWSRLHYARRSFTQTVEDGDFSTLRKARLKEPIDVLEPVTGERPYHAT